MRGDVDRIRQLRAQRAATRRAEARKRAEFAGVPTAAIPIRYCRCSFFDSGTRTPSLRSAKRRLGARIDCLPLKQSRPLLAPAFVIHRNRAERPCVHRIPIMKTLNENNFNNHNRDAERGEHDDGERRGGIAQPFIITDGVASFQDGNGGERSRYQRRA